MDVPEIRVLLAEDDEDDYIITRDLLRRIKSQSFRLLWAPSYSAALESIDRDRHDLYLFDYHLGEEDGLSLLRETRARGRTAPVILLTGLDDWETDVQAMKAGAADYLVKGQFDAKLLERVIRYALERMRAEQALKNYAAAIERKNTELAQAVRMVQEATELKGQFVANVSHEIRTPMNGVLAMTSLLLDTPLAPDQRDYAETAFQSANALLEIIDDILDLSKIEAGKFQLVNAPFEPAKIVEEVLKLLSGRARGKGLKLELAVAPEALFEFEGDAGRLRQVLLNLAGNAIKFTASGEVAVGVRVLDASGPLSKLLFEVEDTGIGLSEETKARLFQPFFQADGSITRQYGGTGLGLAISKQLIEMMGGQVGVDAELGKGSRFWFTVEFQKCQPSARRSISLADESRNPAWSQAGS